MTTAATRAQGRARDTASLDATKRAPHRACVDRTPRRSDLIATSFRTDHLHGAHCNGAPAPSRFEHNTEVASVSSSLTALEIHSDRSHLTKMLELRRDDAWGSRAARSQHGRTDTQRRGAPTDESPRWPIHAMRRWRESDCRLSKISGLESVTSVSSKTIRGSRPCMIPRIAWINGLARTMCLDQYRVCAYIGPHGCVDGD